MLDPADPMTRFALRMGLCLLGLIAVALWLRGRAERVRRARGDPPKDASAGQALRHFLRPLPASRAGETERDRLLYEQTIRALIAELRRLDPDNETARAAQHVLDR